MSRKREHAVDCEMAKRGVWLVKVPRYLSDLWEANAGTDVGRLVIHQGANGKGDVSCFRTFRFRSFIVKEFFLRYKPRFLVRSYLIISESVFFPACAIPIASLVRSFLKWRLLSILLSLYVCFPPHFYR
ncbi:hypothetical protein ANCCAN_16878 [Ancylostoma caninum]|uniref:TFIIF beta subunit N-terminal domain-containing protein n=1 Tax=Ancylostoma caninum TaxID=29170 RepID=A0A368G3P3_ANCCA|nr:hypothetical protein ANCCAN_16878 [Ancylostoma caninum]